MSLRRIEIIKLNEEYITKNEQDFGFEHLSKEDDEGCNRKPNKIKVSAFAKYEDKTKCGEIFISNSGKMHYSCLFCDLTFKKAEQFKNHIFKQHLNLEEGEYDDSDADDPPPNLSDDGEDNEDYDIVSEDVGDSFKIIDGDYTTVLAMDEDPIKLEPVVQLNQTSGNKDYIEHFRNFLEDTLSGSTAHKNEKDNISVLQSASTTESTNTRRATLRPVKVANSDLHCEVCNKKFKTKRGKDNHKKRCAQELVTPSNDIMLSESSDNESERKTSVQTMDLRKCLYCGKECRNRSERIGHERTHTGEKPFLCPVCGKCFRLNRQLVAHKRIHTGERPFPCPQCPAKFANKTNMSVHLRAHLGIKRFSCEVCGKRFVRNMEKTLHMRNHTCEKPHQCEVCGIRYSTSTKLIDHVKRHTHKTHQCEICHKFFYTKTQLKNHQPTHSDERPFECDLCHAKFPRKRALQCHIKIHSDVKEYVCNICGRAFSQSSGLYIHSTLVHGCKGSVKRTNDEVV